MPGPSQSAAAASRAPFQRYCCQPRSTINLTSSRIASSSCLLATRVASGVCTTIRSSTPSVTSKWLSGPRTIVPVVRNPRCARRDRVARVVDPLQPRDRLPTTHVVPRERRLDDHHVAGMLHHGVVDRHPLDGREFPCEHLGVVAGVEGGGDPPQVGHHLRLPLFEGRQDRRGAPNEDARVPIERTGIEVAAGDVGFRLFTKLLDTEHRHGARGRGQHGAGQRFAALDVAERFGRITRTNSVGDNPPGRFLDQLGAQRDGLLESGVAGNHVIRGHDGHHAAGIGAFDDHCRQANAGRRVAPARLADDRPLGELRQLIPDVVDQRRASDDQHALAGYELAEPLDGRLNHRPPADQPQQLFGRKLRLSGQNLVPDPPAMITAWSIV